MKKSKNKEFSEKRGKQNFQKEMLLLQRERNDRHIKCLREMVEEQRKQTILEH